PSPATSAPGTLTFTSTGPPSTPMRWADTPTQMSPERTVSSAVLTHSGLASTPPLTLSHSSITLPLNFDGSDGARTTTRVLYGAVPSGTNLHRPLGVSLPATLYDVAVPSAWYSRWTYPSPFRSGGVPSPMNTPLPPFSSFAMSATGPGGRGCVFAVDADVVVVLAVDVPLPLLEH